MSLRVRLLAAFAYVLVLVLVALEIPLALSLSSRVEAEVRAQASAQAQLVAAAAAGSASDSARLERLVRDAGRDLGARVIVVDLRGRLLADSAGEGLRLTSYRDRPEIREALAGRPAQGERRSDTLGEELLFTAVPVIDGGRRVGAVRVTQSVEAVGDRVRRNVLVLVGVGAIALLLGLALAWVLAGSLSRPLRALAHTARRIERGELDARVEIQGAKEQREVAVAFNEMTERLSQALASQRDFVANASHQLRTPLTGLRLRLEAAGVKARDPELERELQAAEREADRLTNLLNALLVLARQGDRPPLREPASLAEVCEAARERWLPRAEETGHELDIHPGPPTLVRALDDDLAVILDNLIENALVYAPAGTRVTLTWSEDGRLVVLDEGRGITPGEEDALFTRFHRGRSDLPGTGLGLAIVKLLAERWGGSASIGNREGGGARVEVALPVEQRTRVPA